jgi:hypothetical protein
MSAILSFLSHPPAVDWSPGAGAIWLAAYVAVLTVGGVALTVAGLRAAPVSQ